MPVTEAATERLDLIRLYAALPPHLARKLVKNCTTATAAWKKYPAWADLGVDAQQWARARRFTRAWARVTLEHLSQAGVSVVTPSLPGYPSILREGLGEKEDAPPLLFIRGSWEPMDEGAVSLVGTRRCTPYGEGVASDLASALAQEGITVVSGLARGIDAAAHRAALEAGGRTVAVMATGPDRVYPPDNRGLARSIESQGALITEFPPGTTPEAYYFPHRNRIIAALSLVTVVVEAGERSGALITARLADEMNRQVFAVPGPIGRRQSVGCHRLIQDGTALLGSVEELLETIQALRAETPRQGLLPGLAGRDGKAGLDARDPQHWLYDRLDSEPITLEELVRRSGGDVGAVQAGLSLLEFRGLALRVGGRYWRRR